MEFLQSQLLNTTYEEACAYKFEDQWNRSNTPAFIFKLMLSLILLTFLVTVFGVLLYRRYKPPSRRDVVVNELRRFNIHVDEDNAI